MKRHNLSLYLTNLLMLAVLVYGAANITGTWLRTGTTRTDQGTLHLQPFDHMPVP